MKNCITNKKFMCIIFGDSVMFEVCSGQDLRGTVILMMMYVALTGNIHDSN